MKSNYINLAAVGVRFEKRYLLVAIAWLGYALAWVLPVHQYGVELPKGLPGWQAFLVSVSPLLAFLKREPIDFSPMNAILSVLSGAAKY